MSENKKLVIYAKKVDTDEVFEIRGLEGATDRLEYLNLSCMRIISLPVDLSKFWRLDYVDLSRNGLTYLPNLVCLPNLKTLVVNNNQLPVLPELPEGLKHLSCNNNLLPVLPELPERLTILYCNNNQLEMLPDLPSRLECLTCDFNRLVKLPELPATLDELSCRNNQLEMLPKFPPKLYTLFCQFNRLKQLPVFNDRLFKVNCSHNELTRIPYTNQDLLSLKCSNNRIISIQLSEHMVLGGVVLISFDFKHNPVCRVLQYYTRQKLDQPYKLKVIDKFNQTYYGGKLREFIFTRCFEPFVRRKYHPDRLRERLAQCNDDDEEAFQRALSW